MKRTKKEVGRRRRGTAPLAVLFFLTIAAIATISIVGIFVQHNDSIVIQGTVEAPEVRIAGKLAGRVTHIYVVEGECILRGDTLIAIHSPEVEAELRQARAVEGAAREQSAKIDGGTRKEIVASAREAWLSAKAQRTFAESTYRRMERLWRDSVISLWRKEEAEALYLSAKAAEKAAREQYRLAQAGAQKEDRRSAEYMTEAASGGVGVVDALLADAFLTSPTDGTVATIYPEVGELVGTGTPLLSIVELQAPYAIFNIREEWMARFGLGRRLWGSVPALGGEWVEWEVFYIAPLGSFATSRPSNLASGYDMRTFEVHARPTTLTEGLLPGMSILVRLDNQSDQ